MAVTSAVVLVVAIIWIARSVDTPPEEVPPNYFYDVRTGRMFVSSDSAIAPTKAPSGENNGVAAIVVSCASCSDESQLDIAYIAKYNDDVVTFLRSSRTPASPMANLSDKQTMMVQSGLLVSPLPGNPDEEITWHRAQSPEGQKLMASTNSRCGQGRIVQICTPQ